MLLHWYKVPITEDGLLWIEIEAESADDALFRAEEIDDHGLLSIHPLIEKPCKGTPYHETAKRLFPETLSDMPMLVIGMPAPISEPTFGVAFDGMGFHYSAAWFDELKSYWSQSDELLRPDMPVSDFIAAIEAIGYYRKNNKAGCNPSWRYDLSGGRYAGVMLFGNADYDKPSPLPILLYVCSASGQFENFGETVAAGFSGAIEWLKLMSETDGKGRNV